MYADVDIVAKPPIVELVNAHLNRSGVVFVESLPSPWLLGVWAATAFTLVRATGGLRDIYLMKGCGWVLRAASS